MADEFGGGQDEDGGVDEEGAVEGQERIDEVVLACLPLARARLRERTGLHQGRVQVEVVRHDRGAEHADGDVQAVAERWPDPVPAASRGPRRPSRAGPARSR